MAHSVLRRFFARGLLRALAPEQAENALPRLGVAGQRKVAQQRRRFGREVNLNAVALRVWAAEQVKKGSHEREL